MKLTKKKKKFIRDNYEDLSLAELAKETGVEDRLIEKYIKKELKGKSSKYKHKVKKEINGKIILSREKIGTVKELWKFLYEHRGIVLILTLLTLGVYANSLGGDFVSDDLRAYVNNPVVHDLNASLRTLNFNRILFALFYAAFGLNEVPLHLFSLGLHLITTILVFVFVSMTFDKRIGVISALIFAVHPVNTEAVDWISGRKYLMIALIILTTLIFYTMYKNTRNIRYLIASYVTFGVSIAITLFSWLIVTPVLLVITDQLFIERKITKKTWPAQIPIFAIVGLFTGIFLVNKYIQRVRNLTTRFDFNYEATSPLPTRIIYTIYNTVELYVFPKDLTIYHEGEYLSQGFFMFMIFVTVLFLGAIVYFWKKDIRVSGLLLFILVSIAPTLSPQQIAWLIAERYLYTGTIAFSILLALFLIWLETRSRINNLTVYLLVLILSVYSMRTFIRNNDWATRESFWEATQRASPNSARVYNNLGDVYGKKGDHALAIQAFQAAIMLNPQYTEAMHNLGNTYAEIGDFETARVYFSKALEVDPKQYQTIHMLGVLKLEEGDFAEAQRLFEEALKYNPNYAAAQEGLQIAIQQQQQSP